MDKKDASPPCRKPAVLTHKSHYAKRKRTAAKRTVIGPTLNFFNSLIFRSLRSERYGLHHNLVILGPKHGSEGGLKDVGFASLWSDPYCSPKFGPMLTQ